MGLSRSLMRSEHDEQVSLIRECSERWPELRIIAIPNGGYRSKRTAGALKAEGVRPGVPDLFIPALNLWIELKRADGGRVSREQRDWIEYLTSQGHKAVVAHGARSALTIICEAIDARK